MTHTPRVKKKKYPTWAVVGITLAWFILLVPISFFCLHLVASMLWVGRIPFETTYRLYPILSILIAAYVAYPLHRRIKGIRPSLSSQCVHCGFDNASSSAMFCTKCERMRVPLFRFFTIWDWVYAFLGFLVFAAVLRAVLPPVMRAVGFPWPGGSARVVTHYVALLLACGNTALRLKAKIKEQRESFKMQRVEFGTHCECGYDLTGNASGVCPECGTEIEAT